MQKKTTVSENEEPNDDKDEALHHTGDKSFKAVMKVKESALEYIQQFFPLLFGLIDTTNFVLDNTNYITKGFTEFYSDVVYRSELKERIGKKKKIITIVLLFEHKKTIKSYFALFLQLLEYIVLIWKEDLANKKKPSVIIPIVFFQGKRGLRAKEMHDCFKDVPKELLPHIPNFRCHLTNVHDLTNETITSLNEEGLLRSLLLAYTYTERKDKISNILIEIFKFFQYDPEKLDFFKLIFDFLIQEDYLSADELNEFLNQFSSPKIKENMLTTAQVWKKEGKIEGKIETARLTVLRSKWRGLPLDVITDISDLPFEDVENMIEDYNHVLVMWSQKQSISTIEHLSDSEVKYLINLFNKSNN
jgi:predicted transposase/invertase (TIGR01784 family)